MVGFCEPASLGVPGTGLVGLEMGLSEDGSLWRVYVRSILSGFGRLWRGGDWTRGCLFLAGTGLDGSAVRGARGSGAARDGAGRYSSDIAIRVKVVLELRSGGSGSWD